MISEGDIQRGYFYKLVILDVRSLYPRDKEDTRYIIQRNPLKAVGIIAVLSNEINLFDDSNELKNHCEFDSLIISPKLLYKSKKGVYFKKKVSNTSKRNVYLTEEDLSILTLKYPSLNLYTFEKDSK